MNGRVAKAGTEVRPADELTIRYGKKVTVVRVLELVDNPRKEAAADLYEVISGDRGEVDTD